MKRIRTLLVDDERLARRGLELRLAAAPDVEIVGECQNGREAIEHVAELAPDLMFLDIQMPGLSGFDVLARLPQDSMPVVVFVTAFDRYAIDAFEARALDYLLKPVEDARLEHALERVRTHLGERALLAQHERMLGLLADVQGAGELAPEELLARVAGEAPARYPDVLAIRTGRDVVRIPSAEIDWIDAAGDYMCIHAAGETHVLRATMKQLESSLDPQTFQRVHRSAIVNLRRVRKLRPHANGEYFLTLESGQELKLSRSHRDKVELLLDGSLRRPA
ncbi:MAG TPA: LytTR family DNA-binding domain-containing protein [Steroidobacteraceae bacterium]|nr:LytTR family DNA-binding domain-containing protein [Steroidobacteraceae bacterium]